MIAISVDTPGQSREFAEKIAADGKGKVDYPILSDPGHRVIDAYGIRDPDYNGQKFEGIARPTNADIRAALEAVGTDEISKVIDSPKVTDQYYVGHHNSATNH